MNTNGLVARVVTLLMALAVAHATLKMGDVVLELPLPQQPQALFWYQSQLHVAVGLLDARNKSMHGELLRLNSDGSVNATLEFPLACDRSTCDLDVSQFALEGSVAYFNTFANDIDLQSAHWSLVSVDLDAWQLLASFDSSANDSAAFRLLPFNASQAFLFDSRLTHKGVQGRLTQFALPITPGSMGAPEDIALNYVLNGAGVDEQRLFVCDYSALELSYGIGVLDATTLRLEQWAKADCVYSAYVATRQLIAVASSSRERETELFLVDTTQRLPRTFNATAVYRFAPPSGLAANAQYAFVVATDFLLRLSTLVQVDISHPQQLLVVDSVPFPKPYVHQDANLQSLLSYTVNDATQQVVGVVQNKDTLGYGILFVDFS